MQDEADFKADRRAKMLQTLTVADDGRVVSKAAANLDAEKAIKTILIVAEDSALSIEERMEAKMQLDSYFSAKFVVQPKKQETITNTIQAYIVPRDGWHWCLLCEKWCTECHEKSTDHQNRVLEMAAITEMIGPCTSLRRWAPTPGLQGPLTKNAFKAFLGADVETMP